MRILLTIFLLLKALTINASSYHQSSRYVDVNISPKQAQIDPLFVVIDFYFPKQINTVGDALYLLTEPSGYRFNLKEQDVAYILFEMPLPEVHKHLGPMILKDAVGVLSGKGFTPKFDEATRLISFESTSQSIDMLDANLFKQSWITKHPSINPVFHTIKSSLSNYKGSSADLSETVESNLNYTDKAVFQTYKVKTGDSVSRIANLLGINYTQSFVKELVNSNPHAFLKSNPNLLLADEIIEVPYL